MSKDQVKRIKCKKIYEEVIFTYINRIFFVCLFVLFRMHFCDFVTNTDTNLLQV